MSDPPSYDQHLLDRLNALKKSNIQLTSSRSNPVSGSSPNLPAPESDLSARLRSLRNSSSPLTPLTKPSTTTKPSTVSELPLEERDPLLNPLDPNEKNLDELLSGLGHDDQWKLNPDDPSDVQKLLDEAKEALPKEAILPSNKTIDSKNKSIKESGIPKPDFLTRDLDMSVFALDEEEEDDVDQGQEETSEDIIARLLDEVHFEKLNDGKQKEESETTLSLPEGESERDIGLSLPSAPSKLPDLSPTIDSSRESIDFESDIAARMALLRGLGPANDLGLPSAPTFKPVDPPVKGSIPKFRDEEIDSWCIICQDDATVKCIGCSGDLYCARCWKEGHMGPNIGWEERQHKWTKYKKPN